VKAAPPAPSPYPAGSTEHALLDGLPALYVPEASQWLNTSTSRLAFDGYSWMQAVHWVAGSGLYEPRQHRKHGPRSFGGPTARVAQELAKLFPCRPGIAYLTRVTGMSERTVEYHLQMLRETGLLAYIAKGTRVRGGPPMASEFALTIPPAFDQALGIHTVQRHETAPDYIRAVAGISDAGRALMAKLGEKAARKVRKPRQKPSPGRSPKASKPAPQHDAPEAVKNRQEATPAPVSGDGRCTPMQSRCSALPTAGSTPNPSETKLASGKRKSSPRKKAKRGPRKLNKTGRRHQLAGELMRRVPWLRTASQDRIAWVVSDISDAGWTADEVLACLDLRQAPPTGVWRASGFLAARLRGMTAMPGWTKAEDRATQVEHRNAAVEAARKHRIQQVRAVQERSGPDWQPPTSAAVRRDADELILAALSPTPAREPADTWDDAPPADNPATPEEAIQEMREAARNALLAGDTSWIDSAVITGGIADAERLYGPDLVAQARRLNSMTPPTVRTRKGRP